MPGPPPKPAAQRRRRNAMPAETVLPGAGRQGLPPVWPLGDLLPGELDLWRALWATPQAVAWERLGWPRVVARYTRLAVRADCPNASGPVLVETRQLEDRLGLSPLALRRLLWRVDDRDEVAERREDRAVSSRDRMRAVDPDAVAGS